MLTKDQIKMLKFEQRLLAEKTAQRRKLLFKLELLKDKIDELAREIETQKERIEWYEKKDKHPFLHL